MQRINMLRASLNKCFKEMVYIIIIIIISEFYECYNISGYVNSCYYVIVVPSFVSECKIDHRLMNT